MNQTEIKQLAEKHGLGIEESSIKINESGLDFRVAHAKDQSGKKWILRIPRREDSLKHGQQEKAALDLIGNEVSFQVPQWTVFSNELIAYQQLSGVPTATIDMEKQAYVWTFDENNAPEAYHKSLGNVMADLHSLSTDHFAKTGVEMLTGEAVRKQMTERMEKVKQQFDIDPHLWKRWQTWLNNDALWPKFSGVKHGDLHPGHILINEQAEVTGLIDWTEVGVGDVSYDFTAHYQIFGEEGLETLIQAYKKAGGRTWTGMKEHIIELRAASPILVAEFALSSGLEEMYEMAKNMLAAKE
ncbi:macrolide 2'-phosphotransferase [Shouchella sp. 1P09AA]|uniref:macrolide 2'-phosphotransferase n=1 Tax=unclassified Shouchella TaxID=2893065 RepID=UPI0039A20EC1